MYYFPVSRGLSRREKNEWKGRDPSVGQNLFRTSNLIGPCWPEALLFQSWGSLLVLFGLGLSIVFKTNPVSRS